MIAPTPKSFRSGSYRNRAPIDSIRTEVLQRPKAGQQLAIDLSISKAFCLRSLRCSMSRPPVLGLANESTGKLSRFRENELILFIKGRKPKEVGNELGLPKAAPMIDSPCEDVKQSHSPPRPSDVNYRIARTYEERLESFQLVYQGYLEKGLIDPNPYEMRLTPYHLLPTTHIFIAELNGQIICTVSLIGDAELGLPMESIYSDQVDSERHQGLVLGEVSSLAVRDLDFKCFLPVFIRLLRLMSQYARSNGMDQFMIATHPKHARFYQRFMGFQQIGGKKEYPSVCHAPAVACRLNFEQCDREQPACYDQVFGNPLPESELYSEPMSEKETELFRPIAELSGACVPVTA